MIFGIGKGKGGKAGWGVASRLWRGLEAPFEVAFSVARRPKARAVVGVNVHVLPAGPIQTNAYLLTDSVGKEAVLIDAPEGVWDEVEPILHREGCSQAKVVAHEADRVLYESPSIMSKFLGEDLKLEPVRVDHWVGQGDRLEALGESVEVRHVPGHCPGNILFYFAGSKAAFVGDALFRASIGRTDLPQGNFHELERSIKGQIYTLPDDTVVFPGHGGETSVGQEKATNPYVRG